MYTYIFYILVSIDVLLESTLCILWAVVMRSVPIQSLNISKKLSLLTLTYGT